MFECYTGVDVELDPKLATVSPLAASIIGQGRNVAEVDMPLGSVLVLLLLATATAAGIGAVGRG
jgi:hypothetical protein